MTTSYYQRTDQLLMVLHNKINNNKRMSDNLEKPHGIKTWKAETRAVPSFSNWIQFYEKHLVREQDYEGKEPSDPCLKFTLDQSVIPESMLDIDNQKIQNIETNVHQFLPDDNSVMNCETFEIGGRKHQKSIVFKDKFCFGISKIQGQDYMEQPEQYGLASYKQLDSESGHSQFWLNF